MTKVPGPRRSSGFIRATPPILGVDSVRKKVIKAYRTQAALFDPVVPPEQNATEIKTDDVDELDLEALLDSKPEAA